MKDLLQEHNFCNMMKQNKCFKSDRGSCTDLLIRNSKFSFMTANSFETDLSDHHHILFSKQNFELKKLIFRNSKQYFDQFKLDIFNSMSAMRTHAAFENNFVSIFDKYDPKKIKNFTRE